MKSGSSRFDFSRSTRVAAGVALLTLVCLMTLTITGWHFVDGIESRSTAARFNARVQQVTIQLSSRLAGYEKILRGALGLLRASEHVTREEWRTFFNSLELDTHYPGIQGLGFTQHIKPEDLATHIESVRRQGFPDYRVWPEGSRPEYTSIVYLEPFTGRNLRAFGYDMNTDPVRQDAIRRARDSGEAAMTRKVTLVQETGQDVQPGFLMYLPYYGKGDQPVGVAARTAAIQGYVYAPFRMKDLLEGIFNSDFHDLDIEIYDDPAAGESSLLFDSDPGIASSASPLSRLKSQTSLDLYGRTWYIHATPTAAFEEAGDGTWSSIVLLAPILICLLVSAIVWALVVNRFRAIELADANRNLETEIKEKVAATSALAQTKERYRQVVESITDAFFTLTTDWRFTYVSPRAEVLLGRASSDLLNMNVLEAFPAFLGTAFELELRRAFEQQVETQFVEHYKPFGTWFEANVYPSPGGVSVFFRDVTGRKHSEEALRLRERAVEASVNAILIVDPNQPDLPIIYVNPAFERITGYSAAEAIGRNCRFLQGDDRNQKGLDKLRSFILDECEGHAVLRNYRKSGELFWNDLYIAPVRDDRGQVTHFVGVLNDITSAMKYQEQLEHQATHDALTGLANRALLRDRIAQAVARAERTSRKVAVIFVDLDNFKLINDGLGHDAGDLVLKLTAERLLTNVRLEDTVARLGGDEFVIVLNDDDSIQNIAQVADRILDVVLQPMQIKGQEIALTCSAGISVYPDDGDDPEALLKNADVAMYKAKECGRNLKQFYTPGMNETILQRLELTNNLRQALGREEFVLHYQPQFNLASNALVGFEVLLRWQHRELGLVSPGQFIPLAEENGIIVPIGEWVIQAACEFYRSLPDLAGPPPVMSVNLSARQLRHQNLVNVIQAALEKSSMPAQLLEFEVTESMVMHDVDEVLKIFSAMKQIGVKLAMDDFGTGYSSLAYLKRFPIDRLKIDRSFVRDITVDPDDAAIAKAIMSLAHTLGIKVVAEGVETVEQLNVLREFGCDEGQGYHFGKPMPAAEFRELLLSLSRTG